MSTEHSDDEPTDSQSDGKQTNPKPDKTASSEALQEFLSEEIAAQLGPDLNSMPPREGIKSFIKSKTSLTQRTREEYRRKLQYFIEFCDEHDIDDLSELDGGDVNAFRQWRKHETAPEPLAPKTMADEMYRFRDFVRHLVAIEAAHPDLPEKVQIPTPDDEEKGRDVDLDPDRAEHILDYLNRFEYATVEHVAFLLLARTGMRLGAVRALDVDDVHLDGDDRYIEVRHREGETRLKDGSRSEREIDLNAAADADICDVLQDYIETTRHDVTDEFGREPLLTSQHGRLTKSTIRSYIYGLTRPCEVGRECPHGRDPTNCEAAGLKNGAAKCPSSRSPHVLRHGFITEALRSGIPVEVICERCDVTQDVLRKHYDERTEGEKRELRRAAMESARNGGGGYL